MSKINKPEDLNALKRADLQKLAKQHGIKANLKNGQLRTSLIEVLFGCPATPATPDNKPEKNPASAVKAKNVETSRSSIPKAAMTPKQRVATPKQRIAAYNSPLFSPRPLSVKSRLSAKPATPRISAAASLKSNTPVQKSHGKRKALETEVAEQPAERPAKRQRRNTFDKEEPSPALIASPSGPEHDAAACNGHDTTAVEGKDTGVEEMLSAMSGEMTDEQMKESLLKTLEKRVPQQDVHVGEKTKLPRYKGLLQNQPKKPTTPGSKDWERIHGKHFSKMQSIEEYMHEKQGRSDKLTASMKRIKQMRDTMKSRVDRFMSYKTPPSVKRSAAKLKARADERKFVPTVTSTSKANFNFTSTLKGNNRTPAVTKLSTPASQAKRNSPVVPGNSNKKQSLKPAFSFAGRTSSSAVSQRKSPRISTSTSENQRTSTGLNRTVTLNKTPFKFNTTTSTSLNVSINNHSVLNNTSVTKPKFDLKASLAKPMTWKPHTGSLKPFSMQDSEDFKTTSLKAVTVKSKADRRAEENKQRADRRMDAKMKRRGINV